AQHVEPGQGRHRRRGRNHAVGGDSGGTAGDCELAHSSSATKGSARRRRRAARRARDLPAIHACSTFTGQFEIPDHMAEMLHFPVATPPAPGEVTPIAPGVLWLRMPLPFALNHINLWLLEDGPGWTIVDCGFAGEQTTALWDRIFAAHLGGRPGRRSPRTA